MALPLNASLRHATRSLSKASVRRRLSRHCGRPRSASRLRTGTWRISGRSAGRGPITRFLEEKIARARIIAEEKETGEDTRRGVVAEINSLMVRYRRTLAAINRDVWERRIDLEAINALIDQKLALLDEAQPVVLMEAYAKELLSGVIIADRPEATARLNSIFKAHGESLRAVLKEHRANDRHILVFRHVTTVGQTLDYVAHFIPIAMVVAVTELVLPLSVWIIRVHHRVLEPLPGIACIDRRFFDRQVG